MRGRKLHTSLSDPLVILLILFVVNFRISSQQFQRSGNYPLLAAVPKTSFSCAGRPAGYYADPEGGCQVYHMCDPLSKKYSYLCPNHTLFNQKFMVCDHWYVVDCSSAPDFYNLNLEIGKPARNSKKKSQHFTKQNKLKESKFSSRKGKIKTTSPTTSTILTDTSGVVNTTPVTVIHVTDVVKSFPGSVARKPASKIKFETAVIGAKKPIDFSSLQGLPIELSNIKPRKIIGEINEQINNSSNTLLHADLASFVNLQPPSLVDSPKDDKIETTAFNSPTSVPQLSTFLELPNEISVEHTSHARPEQEKVNAFQKIPLNPSTFGEVTQERILTPVSFQTPKKQQTQGLTDQPRNVANLIGFHFPSAKANPDFFIPSKGMKPRNNEIIQKNEFSSKFHKSHMTMVFPDVKTRTLSRFQINPLCPNCHPAFLKPGKCTPCVRIR